MYYSSNALQLSFISMPGGEQQIARLCAAQRVWLSGLYESEGITMSHILLSRDQSLEGENKRRLSSLVLGTLKFPSFAYSHHLEYEEPGDQFFHSTLRNHYENIQWRRVQGPNLNWTWDISNQREVIIHCRSQAHLRGREGIKEHTQSKPMMNDRGKMKAK